LSLIVVVSIQPDVTVNVTRGTLEERRRKYYAGESLRELGVLIFVFLPLETLLQKPQYTWRLMAVSLLVGVGLMIWGIGLQLENHLEAG
jgi:hypothetical protein